MSWVKVEQDKINLDDMDWDAFEEKLSSLMIVEESLIKKLSI
jgi:hypothetical protein